MTTTYSITGHRIIFDDDTDELLSFDNVALAVTFDDSVTDLTYALSTFVNGSTQEAEVLITPEALSETIDGLAVDGLHGPLEFVRNIEIFDVPGGDQVVFLTYFYDDSLSFPGASDITVEYEFFIGGAQLPVFDNFPDYDNLSPDDIIAPGPDEDFGPDQPIPLDALNWDSIVDNPDGETTYELPAIQIFWKTVDEDQEFVDSEPVKLGFTLPNAVTNLSYPDLQRDADDVYFEVEFDHETATLVNGSEIETVHPEGHEAFGQIAQFTWSGGTTRMMSLYLSNDDDGPGSTDYEYLLFLDGPVPPVSTFEDFLAFLSDEFGFDPENLSSEEAQAAARAIFQAPDGDFGPGVDIPVAGLNWLAAADDPAPDLSLTGDNGANGMTGGAGDDSLAGERGDDTLLGGDGDDDLRGGVGADSVVGGDDDDFIRGGIGEDTLFGGNGDDVIRGQSNGDTLMGGDGEDNLKGGGGNDFLSGGDHDDFLKGGTRKDLIDGGDGDDKLFGNSFDDTLNGGAGEDRLNAGGDNDQLDGGTGDDTLKGGAGADSFFFNANMGEDVLLDYELGLDDLWISEALLGADIETGTDVADTYGRLDDGVVVLDFGGGNVIEFRGLDSTDGLGNDITVI